MLFPSLWAYSVENNVRTPVALIGTLNTLGGIVGILLGAFAIPYTAGLRRGFVLFSAVYLALFELWRPPLRALAGAFVVVLICIVAIEPGKFQLAHTGESGEVALSLVESPSGIVSVVQMKEDRQLRLDNYYVLGGSQAAVNERRQGLIPLLLHPNPERVAFIGVATGISVSGAPALGVPHTTAIELVPEVSAAARAYFAPWNGGVLDDPGTDIIIDDGRHFLQRRHPKYDVIVSDLFIPWHAATGSLYSSDMYETVKSSLSAEGIFCQWLPMYQLTANEFFIIAHTFGEVFPNAYLWRNDFFPNRPVIGLIGKASPLTVDVVNVRERLARLPVWAVDPFLNSAQALSMLYVVNLNDIRAMYEGVPINSDNLPYIEFRAPTLTHISELGDKEWFVGDSLEHFFDTLARQSLAQGGPFPAMPQFSAGIKAGARLFAYANAEVAHNAECAILLREEIQSLVPEVIDRFDSTSGARHKRHSEEFDHLMEEQAKMEERLKELDSKLREQEHAPH